MRRAAPALHLASTLLSGLAWLAAATASAQSPAPPPNLGLVVRDGTLGSGALEVGPGIDPLGQPASYLITHEMGELRGSNLFHSFERFGIGTHETATFTGPDPIDGAQSVSNVISRVTGGNESRIEGTLRSTIPGADLWLLNPSGVVFGQGAQLDVEGSFHASTADSLGFGADGLERFYSDRSSTSVLSTATPLAFGFLSQSGAASLAVDRSALEVPDGETLELSGGDVSLRLNAALVAPGGGVRLEAQGEVSISQSLVDVGRTGETPGAISIRGGKIVVEKSSLVRAENDSGVPPPAEDAPPAPGSISLEARESVLVDASLLSVSTHGAGHAGTIDVRSPQVTLRNRVGASASAVGPGASGDAGTVEITARRVELKQGSQVSAETAGSGKGGDISIKAGESLLVDDGLLSVNTWSTGSAGTIRIAGLGQGLPDPDVTIRNGPGLPSVDIPRVTERGVRAETQGDGAGGTIEIDADALEVAHGVSVSAGSIGTRQVAQRGDSGNITIDANSVHVSDRSFIATGGWGSTGKAGILTIDLGDHGELVVDGETPVTQVPRPLYAPRYAWILSKNGGRPGSIAILGNGSVELVNGGFIGADSSIGDGGTIAIDASSLEIHSGGRIGAGTSGVGNAGTITIRAGSLEIGNGAIDASSIGGGDAGTITVDADTVQINDEGGIQALSRNTGGIAGTIQIDAKDWIRLEDAGEEPFSLTAILKGSDFSTGVFSTTVSGGNGGSITLIAPEITASKGAVVATTTVGGGDAGDITLSADRIRIEDGAFVDSTSLPFDLDGSGQRVLPGGEAGSVALIANTSIEVVGRHPVSGAASRVASATLNAREAGEVRLTAPRIVLDGGAVSTGAAPFHVGPSGGAGGAITLNAGRDLLVLNGGQVGASTLGSGKAGRIDIQAGESIRVEGTGSSIASRTGADGGGGDVVIRAPQIEVARGGKISAGSAAGLGELSAVIAGLEAEGLLADLPNTAEGNAGSIALAADSILLAGGTLAIDSVDADGGDVRIAAQKLVHLDAGVITASVTGGKGGNIAIDPEVVVLENGSRIVATAAGGSGGRIQITAANYFAFPGSAVSAEANREGLSGTVEVRTPDANLASNLTELPTTYLDASSLMRERCAARASGEPSGSFAVRGNGGTPPEPDGWLRASVFPDAVETAAASMTGPQALVASLPGPLLAQGTCE